MERDPLTGKIIGLAIEVHRILGPGLLESAYEECLCYELSCAGLHFKRQDPLPVLTYMRLGDYRTGLPMNFNTPVLKDGIKRMVL